VRTSDGDADLATKLSLPVPPRDGSTIAGEVPLWVRIAIPS
jgi:hypothetical protein